MTPLMAQFISETRDLIEQASQSFLAIEKDPGDAETMNGLFRAVHTIKGASGLFEIQPFTQVVHAAEDLLDAARDGRVALDPDMIDLLLEALDLLAQWVDALEAAERLPDDAPPAGKAIGERLRRLLSPGGTGRAGAAEPSPVAAPPGVDWLNDVPDALRRELSRQLAQAGGTLMAVDYRPDPQSFFSGQDPLHTLLGLDGRRWFAVDAVHPWPAASELDPFCCNLRLRALVATPADVVRHHLRYVEDEVTLAPVSITDLAPAAADGSSGHRPDLDRTLVAAALDILATQARALQTTAAPDLWVGRVAAAATVLARVLPALGFADEDTDSRAAVAEALKTRSAAPLTQILDRVMARLRQPENPREALAAALPTASETPRRRWDDPPAAEPGRETRKVTSLKVDQARIDALMNLAGELVVAKNSLPFLAKRAEEVYGVRQMAREIKTQYDVINRIVDDLQTAVMQVRMVPVAHVFQRFNRLVRDLAKRLDKRIDLVIEGEDTEADKTVVEELGDPLVHLVRNAIDHGIEMPADRRARGKPEAGTLRLTARQVDDRVIIEIADDGKGIDVARVKQKALEKGLIDEARLAALSDEDALQLIMAPGLSTADQVSDLSGRGVGMDVVKTMVTRTGGRIAVASQPGKGTQVTISLPLSMSVHRVMMIEVGHEVFGVPIENIVETVKVPTASIHHHKDQATIVLRDRLIPLCPLGRVLATDGNGTGSAGDASDGGRSETPLLIAKVDGDEIGFVVDDFRSGIDILLKPLEGILAGLRHYSGTALLGDGSVLLVLNLREILRCQW